MSFRNPTTVVVNLPTVNPFGSSAYARSRGVNNRNVQPTRRGVTAYDDTPAQVEQGTTVLSSTNPFSPGANQRAQRDKPSSRPTRGSRVADEQESDEEVSDARPMPLSGARYDSRGPSPMPHPANSGSRSGSSSS
ncbi:hypothetical protein CTheo_9239 [Ceratobasidium theobromae]|uniref:Uncharacterized protein n=1 Tax=Ceratobasidium theobromae TaxID=1582974 RepID=A0A5N5Q614_9AGAM|nr:hypothetical protein CTheo_9239 [Ceratobasidium theobromae]